MKILILCYDFAPLPSIGAQRPTALYKYLPKYGIEPIVITRKWRENITSHLEYFEADAGLEETLETKFSTLIRLPEKQSLKNRMIVKYGSSRYSLIRKAITFCELFLKWILPLADDKYYLYLAAKKYLAKNKVDLIFATGEPFILFKYAYNLSTEFKTPFIMDYRDGWANNITADSSWLNRVRLNYESIFENKYLKKAKLIINVSERFTEKIVKKYNIEKSKTFLLKNGTDNNYSNLVTKQRGLFFEIIYAGIFYDSYPFHLFLQGLEIFIKKNGTNNIKVKFIGVKLKPSIHLAPLEAFQHKYPTVIEIMESLPPEKLAPYLANANVLLLLLMTSQKSGHITGKVYDYAATRNPILVIQEEQTQETPFFQGRDIQTFAFSSDDVAQKLDYFYSFFLKNQKFQTSITEQEIFSISREYQVRLFAEKIKEFI